MSRENNRRESNANVLRAAAVSSRKSVRARLACEALEGRALLSGMAAGGWHSFASQGSMLGSQGEGSSARANAADVSVSSSSSSSSTPSATPGNTPFTRFQARADRFASMRHGAGHVASTSTSTSASTTAASTDTTADSQAPPDFGSFDPKGGGKPGGDLGMGGTAGLAQLVGLDQGIGLGAGMGGGFGIGGGPGGPGGMMPGMGQASKADASTSTTDAKATPPTLPAAVTTAQTTLETDLKAALPAGFQAPSKDALDALQTDLKAQKDGTLTGTDADTKIQADKDAILASTGLTGSQVTAVDAALKQLDTDLKAVMDANAKSSSSTAAPDPAKAEDPKIVADKDAVLAAAGLTSTQITAIDAAQTQMRKDAAAAHDGTLTGDAATAALKTDHDNLLLAIGVTQDNVDKINTDTQALQDAMKTAFGSTTPDTGTTTKTGATHLTKGMRFPGGPGGAGGMATKANGGSAAGRRFGLG